MVPQVRFWRKPLDLEEQTVPRGVVHLIVERCKECEFCVEFCPRDVLRMSARFNRKGYRIPEVIPGKEDLCVACRHCEDICPEFGIFIEEVKG
ncbi:MAG: 4Fe-4S dicluster domain-containing protein [Candidatus Thermoplasmatota archaeon]